MPNFKIYFLDSAEMNDISDLIAELWNMNGTNIHQYGDYVSATLRWRTDAPSLGNLAGHLNDACNSCVDHVEVA